MTHLILHGTHSGLDKSDTSLHGEDHECAGHDPGRVVVLKLLAELGQVVDGRADVSMLITAFGFVETKMRQK